MSGSLRGVAKAKWIGATAGKGKGRIHILLAGAPLNLFAVAFLCATTCASRPALEYASLLPVLTNITRIKQLKPGEAMRGYPVCLRGIVTFQNAVRDAVIHDGTDGIFVARSNATFDLKQGELVEVRG